MKRKFTRYLLLAMLMVLSTATGLAQKSVLNESFSSGSLPSDWTTAGSYWKFGDGNAKFEALVENGADTLFSQLLDISELDNKPSIAFSYSIAANATKVNELKVLYRAPEDDEWSVWKAFDAATDGQVDIKDVLPDGLSEVQIAIAGAYKLGGETRVYRIAVENKTEASAAPTGLRYEDLTTTSVTLWWDVCESTKFLQYNVKVSTSQMTDMSAVADVVDNVGWMITDEFYELEGLTPNTDYWLYVQYDCGDGDVSPWAELNFKTPCSAITTPFSENFEGELSGCFTIIKGGSAAEVSSEWPYNSTKSFKSVSGKGKYNYLILPEFNGDVKNQQVALMAASMESSTKYARTVTIGVCEEATAESFTEVKTLTLPKGRVWEPIVVSLKGYTGPGKYIAFRFGDADNENRLFVDDIRIEAASDCPKPMFVEVSEITPATAKLKWVETGNASEWNLVLSTKPLNDPEDIEPDAAKGEFAGSISANPYMATNLQSNTTYYAYLQAGCGSSEWTNAVSFKTSKEVAYPYYEDFSRMDADKYTDNIHAIPDGWVMDDRCVNTEYYFDYQYDTHLPYVVTTQNYAQSAYVNAALYLRGTSQSANAYYSSIAMLPAMPKAVKDMTVTFWAKSTNGVQTVVVAVANTQTADLAQGQQLGANIIKVGTVEVPGSSSWAKYSVNMEAYSGEGRYITFYLEPGTGTPSVYIDDISIDDTPDCAAVTGFAAEATGTNSISASWTDATSATSWKVKVSTTALSDPATGTGDIINDAVVNTKSYSKSGLTMGTKYYLYVSPACGDFWESTEVTTAVGLEVPYYIDFTGETTGANASRGPKNWKLGYTYTDSPSATSTNWPYIYNTAYAAANNPPADAKAPYLYVYTGGTTATYQFPYAIMPELLNADVKDLKMSFYGYYNSTTTTANYAAKAGGPFGVLHIGVVNSPADINKTNKFTKVTEVATVRCSKAQTVEMFVVDMSSYTGNGKYIVFYEDTAKYNYFGIDNLTIARPSDPWPVSNVEASEITQTGAKLAWTENGQATKWEVRVFDAAQDDPTAGTPVFNSTVTANSVTITGLSNSTKYFAYVRSVQDNGNGAWGSTSFRTECGVSAVPFTEDWESFATGTASLDESCYTYTAGAKIGGSSAPSGTPKTGNVIQLNATSTNKNPMIVFPEFNKPINTLQLTMVGSSYTSSYVGVQSYLEVGVLEANDNFVVIGTYQQSVYNQWEEYFVNFGSYTGEGGRIALRAPRDVNNKDINMCYDNVVIEQIPQCGRITSIEVAEIDSISAVISWEKGKTENKWNLKVSTTELEDPSAATADVFDGALTEQTKALADLEGNTTYYVYVQSVDEVLECEGQWSNAKTFKTTCKKQTFPYEEDFESYETGSGKDMGCMTQCGDDKGSYITTKGTGNKALWLRQVTKDHNNYFVFPALSVDSVKRLQLSMQVYVGTTATYTYPFEVGVMTDPNDPSTFVATHNEALAGQSAAYDRVYTFEGYAGDETGTKFGTFIAIKPLNYRNSGGTEYVNNAIYIDNVTIDFIETCVKPVDLKTDSIGSYGAKFIWKTDDKTAAHRVRVFTSADADPNSDAFVAEGVANDSVVIIEGLSANAAYYAFVRKECVPDNLSKWSSAVAFITNCAPIQAMPYVEGFETGTSGQAPDCWTSLLLNGSSAKAQITTSSGYVFSGTKAMSVNKYFSQSGPSSYTTGLAAAVTPPLDVESLKDVLMYCDIKSGTTTPNMISLRIEAVSDNTTNAEAIYITTIEDITSTWKKAYIKLGDYYTSVLPYKRLRFTPQSSGTDSQQGGTVYIDNIVFTTDLNVVLPVSGLKAERVDVDSITISFIESTPGIDSWQVAYVAAGGDIADATILNVDATVVTIKGLTSTTSYDIYARSTAAGAEWVGPITAATIDAPASLPYSTGFEDDANLWNLHNVQTVQGNFYPNFFIMSDAAKCGGTGEKALYITNDSINYMSYGTNANMNPEDYPWMSNVVATSYAWATRNVRIPSAGSYIFQFKLKQPGNTLYDNDAAYVQLIPAGATYKGAAATMISGLGRNGSATSDAVANGCYTLVGKTRGENDWTWKSRSLDITEPGAYTVAIYWTNSSSTSASPTAVPLAVDSVIIEEYFCTLPSNVEFVKLTPDEVTLQWFAGKCKNFEYVVSRYAKLGDPSLIDAEDKIAAGILTDGPQVTISNLEASTQYSFYVRTICADGETDWVEFRFLTPCGAENLPYTESFAETPGCWILSGATVGTSNYYTEEMKAAGLEIEKWPSMTLSNTGIAILPELNVPLNKINVELAAFCGQYEGSVSLGVVDNTWDKSTFQELALVSPEKVSGSISGAISGSGYPYKVKVLSKMLNLYNGTGKYLALRNTSGQTVYIKYIKLTELADCIQPYQVEITNITEGAATVNWIPGLETAWEIQLNDSIIKNVTTQPYQITGLEQGTDYTVAVRAICDATHSSEWSASVTFRTNCGVNPLPLVEDFSGLKYHEKAALQCWEMKLSDQSILNSSTATFSNAPAQLSYSYTWTANWLSALGERAQLLSWDTKNDNFYKEYKYRWFISPQFAIEGDATLSFDARMCNNVGGKANNPQGQFYVAISTDNGATWAKSNAHNLTSQLDSVYHTYDISLADYAGQNIRVAFYHEGLSSGLGVNSIFVLVDNVRMNCSDTYPYADNACQGFDYEGYGFSIAKEDLPIADKDSTYYRFAANAGAGCDSTIALTITARKAAEVAPVYATICQGETYDFGPYHLTEPNPVGVPYYITGETQYGCDSTIYLYLTVNESDTTDMTPVEVKSNQLPYIVDEYYTIPMDASVGSFTAVAKTDGCSFNRYFITVVDTPTGIVNISDEIDYIEIYDALGRKLQTLRQGDSRNSLPTGVYMIRTIMKSGDAVNRKVTF